MFFEHVHVLLSSFARVIVHLLVRSCARILGNGKRGHIVADTWLLMMFLGLGKPGNICCADKMFLNKIRNIFLCPGHKTMKHHNNETISIIRSETIVNCYCTLEKSGIKCLLPYKNPVRHFIIIFLWQNL